MNNKRLCDQTILLWLPTLLLIVSLGCGGHAAGSVPVSGVVRLDGEPLPKAYVAFQPMQAGFEAPSAYGITDGNGRYSLRLMISDEKGAMPGKHQITIELRDYEVDSADDEAQAFPESLPARYNRETQLEFDVPASGTDAADFDLTSE